MIRVSCPNKGCKEDFTKSQIEDHLQNCQYSGEISTQMNMQDPSEIHSFAAKTKSLKQKCHFASLGCFFVGDDSELAIHMQKEMNNHLEYICKFLLSDFYKPNSPTIKANERSQFTDLETVKVKFEHAMNKSDEIKSQAIEIQRNQKDIAFRLNGVEDLLTTIQASITEINHTYEEVSLTLQILQATSYNGKYIWKIPDITRRRRDAVTGKTVSLYSAPFYTDRFGYRMCLRVYLDGDGSGKGCYISYFLTIMKGEYDALLEWPFQLTVTMTMINQKGNGNITQSFKPNPSSASFHRPKADMNVASGCPKFAALSVLDNKEFVVDDVAFFQCVVSGK